MADTQNTFNQIAEGWYTFRHWSIFRQELETLAARWQKGRLINIGCAHGPDFLPFRQDFDLYGIDFSEEMIRLARKYSGKFSFAVNLSVADLSYLPYAAHTFDFAIAVATYHHIKGKEGRQSALAELYRVLKPGGEAFITLWNRWQPRFWLSHREVNIPWRKQGQTLYRYYYLFSYTEIEKQLRKAGFEILKSFPESSHHCPIKTFSRNICLLAKKSSK